MGKGNILFFNPFFRLIYFFEVLALCDFIEFCSGQDRALKGIDPLLLEDGPLRPVDAFGNPIVPSIPGTWWFDGGIVAPPDFSTKDGVFVDSVLVRLYCGTEGSTISYILSDVVDPNDVPDPTPYEGTIYNGDGVLVLRTGIIKAMAFHPYAMDSDVSFTGTIFIKSPAPRITLVQDPSPNPAFQPAIINASGPAAPARLGPFNGSVTVAISAATASGGRPYIRYTLNTTAPTPFAGADPPPVDPQGEARVTLLLQQTAVVRAVAWEPGRIPSAVTGTGVIQASASPARPPASAAREPVAASGCAFDDGGCILDERVAAAGWAPRRRQPRRVPRGL